MNSRVQLPYYRRYAGCSTQMAGLFAIFLMAPSAVLHCAAQAPAIDQLRQKLTGPNAAVTLALTSLRLSKLFPRAELKIDNGVPKPGPFNFPLNTDHVVQSGTQLSVGKVELSSDKKNDVLHVTVSDTDGYTAKLGIVLTKDPSRATGEGALEQALQPVLTFAAGATESASHADTPSPVPPPPPTPAQPVHSAQTVDFAAAGEGYPPMHANSAAPAGCWFEPYHSDPLGVEFLYVQCAAGQGEVQHVSDGPKGPVGVNSMGPPEFFTIHEKLANETLQAAVKRVIIAKFADPAARIACHVSMDPSGNRAEIAASGPYTRKTSYRLSKDGTPCDGYLDTEDRGTSFITLPKEDKTKFIEAPSGKAYIEYPFESVHLRVAESASATGSSSSAQTSAATPVSQHSAKPQPVMPKVWVTQGQTPGIDLAPEAGTSVTSSHGFVMGMTSEPAIEAVACESVKGGAPRLVGRIVMHTYPGVEENAFNPVAQVNFGDSRHDAQIVGELGQQWMIVTFPLTAADVQALDRQHMITAATVGVTFFKGQRIIVSGALPPANEVLDTVLHACNAQTSARATPVPTAKLTPDAIRSLTIGKLTLGSSVDEVKRALGPGFHFLPASNTQSPRIAYLIASDTSDTDIYGLTFIDGALRNFSWQHNFPPGAQPLAENLTRNMTEKTWAPLTGSSISDTVWATNEAYVPIQPQEETSHSSCKVIRDASLNIPYQVRDQAKVHGGFVVDFIDPGPSCGVTIQMAVAQGQADKTMARFFNLRVADYGPMHSVVSGVAHQEQQQTDANRKKASQVASPF